MVDIEAARRVFPVVTVQNRYNLLDRGSQDVLNYCAANNIGFIPWFPLVAGELTRPGGTVDRIASAHGATTGQVALAWLLQRCPGRASGRKRGGGERVAVTSRNRRTRRRGVVSGSQAISRPIPSGW